MKTPKGFRRWHVESNEHGYVTKREFKKILLSKSLDWYTEFVAGYFRYFGEISRDDIGHYQYPIYVGEWNTEHYGVFLDHSPTEDESVYDILRVIKKIDADVYYEGDRT